MHRKKPQFIESLQIESYAAEGRSLARQEGKVIFVEGAVPGDVVDVRLTKSKKDWGEGVPISFRHLSADRVEPFCQHFGVCGGCQWQMLPYEKQLQYKQQQVLDVLQRIGKVALPQTLPIAGAAETRFYRNKLEYTFSTREFTPDKASAEAEQGAAGFHAKGFFDKVVQIQKCWLQPEPTNEIRNFIRDYAYEKHIPFYDIRRHEGFLRTMQVRLCRSGELMVNIVLADDAEAPRRELFQNLIPRFPQVTTWLYTINKKWNDSIYDLQPQVVSGPGFVVETLENFRFKIGPQSFFQTNTHQAETLYQITRRFAELNGTQTLYDLYCGTGSIGIFCSAGATKLVGVETVEAAVADARVNAEMNELANAAFFAGDVVDVCTATFFETHGRPDVIITDPPRAGMHEKLVQKILDIEAPVVVYVSCNPATQARDVALLDAKYAVTALQAVDMFPHTHHIENVVQLKLKS